MYIKKTRKNCQKPQQQQHQKIVLAGVGACKTRAVTGTGTYDARAYIRSHPAAANIRTTDIHQPPPHKTGRDPHAKETEE
jgi:hypothetical protein